MRCRLNKKHRRDHNRDRAQCCQCKRQIFNCHNHNDSDNRYKVRDQRCDCIGQYFLQRIDITDDPRQDFSGRTTVKKGKRQCLNVFVQFLSYNHQYIIGNLRHHIHAHLDHNQKQDIECDCKDSDLHKTSVISHCNMVIDCFLDQQRINKLYGNRDRHTKQHSDHAFFIVL